MTNWKDVSQHSVYKASCHILYRYLNPQHGKKAIHSNITKHMSHPHMENEVNLQLFSF